MLFEKKGGDEDVRRYASREEAEAGHDEMVREYIARQGVNMRIESPDGYKCPRCLLVSHHPKDIENRYCGHCHQFEDLRRVEG